MNYCTLDRFQGAWLGGIIGSAISGNTDKSDYDKILQDQFPDWIRARSTVAQIMVENQQTSVAIRLAKFLSEYLANSCQKDIQHTLKNNTVEQMQQNKLVVSHCFVSSLLLPLTIFQEDYQGICREVIAQDNIKLADIMEIEQDIAIWNYLLSLVFNNKLELEKSNVGMIVKQLSSGVEIKATSLVQKLEIVSQAWESGLSLQQLTEKLYEQEKNEQSTINMIVLAPKFAIALSLYCFISTPENFGLSVKRASSINILSKPIAILTATISGAYNGMAGIPRIWKKAAECHQNYPEAKNTVEELFKIWLGMDSRNSLILPYDPEINTVAVPKIIQPRHNLKIISQKLDLS